MSSLKLTNELYLPSVFIFILTVSMWLGSTFNLMFHIKAFDFSLGIITNFSQSRNKVVTNTSVVVLYKNKFILCLKNLGKLKLEFNKWFRVPELILIVTRFLNETKCQSTNKNIIKSRHYN